MFLRSFLLVNVIVGVILPCLPQALKLVILFLYIETLGARK